MAKSFGFQLGPQGGLLLILLDLGLVIQDDIQQGVMDFKFSIVVDIAQFAEFVHEVAHARSSRSNHLREGFLTELSDNRFRPAVLAEIREEKKNAGEALFARIEQLVD